MTTFNTRGARLMALEALKEYANPNNWDEDYEGVKREWLEPDVSPRSGYTGFGLAQDAITALERELAQPVEPFAWCVDSKNSADWCFSATKAGVQANAKLMDRDCEKTEPFPVFTSPQAPAVNAELLEALKLMLEEFGDDISGDYVATNAARAAIARAEKS